MGELFQKQSPDAGDANKYRYGDILSAGNEEEGDSAAPKRQLSDDEELYRANYDFDSLISECCTWHYWQFMPSEGVTRQGIYKQYTEFELAITPLSNLLFIYRQKLLWDKIQISGANKQMKDYEAAVKAAARKSKA